MAYTIYKSDGTVLTTIADGTINTTSTSLGLPGRNYAGYGQPVDTNFVHVLENFADTNPPSNPLRGQLWYDTNSSTLKICPTDGESNGAAWATLTSTASGGTTTFANVTVTGNINCNNLTATNQVGANSGVFSYLTVTIQANIANSNTTNATIGTTTTAAIQVEAGNNAATGTITGTWTVNGAGTANSYAGTGLYLNNGNLVIAGAANIGIRTDKYYYANGDPVSFAGTYSNSNVASYLPTYGGNILANTITATRIVGKEQSTISAGSFVIGKTYIIATVGSTNFTSIGAASNAAGVQFTATGIGTGTGTAILLETVAATAIVAGYSYQIASVGTTNWTSIGAASNTANVQFTATGVGAGTGTAIPINSFYGVWALTPGSRLTATYADLAERFAADAIYDAGTVVELGGENEITAVKYELSEDVFGVISNTAAYLMNAGAGSDATHPPVAVSGRVKVKVIGKVKKGDRLVSAGEGMARAAINNEATAFNTIGRALEHKLSDGTGFVEAIVIIR